MPFPPHRKTEEEEEEEGSPLIGEETRANESLGNSGGYENRYRPRLPVSSSRYSMVKRTMQWGKLLLYAALEKSRCY